MNATARKAYWKDLGIHERGSLYEDLAHDYIAQTPYDPFHAEFMGNSSEIMKIFAAWLKPESILELNERIIMLETPSHWSTGLTPWILSGGKSSTPGVPKLTGSQKGKFFQMAGIMLRGLLCPEKFRGGIPQDLEERLGASWVKDIVEMFIAHGLLCKELFSIENVSRSTEENMKAMSEAATKSRRCTARVIGGEHFKNRNNFHICHTYSRDIEQYASCRNVNVSRYETSHGPHRAVVHNTNHRNLELDMLKKSDGFDAMCFAAAGGLMHSTSETKVGVGFNQFMQTKLMQEMNRAKGLTIYHAEDALDVVEKNNTIRFKKRRVLDPVQLEGQAYSNLGILLARASLRTDAGSMVTRSSKSVTLPFREKWRSTICKGCFYSLKGSAEIIYVEDILTFCWPSASPGLQEEIVESRCLIRRVRANGRRDECTGFPILQLAPMSADLLSFDKVASPVHVLHLCAANSEDCSTTFGAGYKGTHDFVPNNNFLFNDTFYE